MAREFARSALSPQVSDGVLGPESELGTTGIETTVNRVLWAARQRRSTPIALPDQPLGQTPPRSNIPVVPRQAGDEAGDLRAGGESPHLRHEATPIPTGDRVSERDTAQRTTRRQTGSSCLQTVEGEGERPLENVGMDEDAAEEIGPQISSPYVYEGGGIR